MKKLKMFRVDVSYEYLSSNYNIGISNRIVSEIEFAESKQKLIKRLKRKFKHSTILDLEITEIK